MNRQYYKSGDGSWWTSIGYKILCVDDTLPYKYSSHTHKWIEIDRVYLTYVQSQTPISYEDAMLEML